MTFLTVWQRCWIVLCGSALLVALAGPARADPELVSSDFIPSLHKAEFIFEGVVIAVEYKSSRPARTGDAPIPHTFVTLEIRKVYKGNPGPRPLRAITLRFLGGSRANAVESWRYPGYHCSMSATTTSCWSSGTRRARARWSRAPRDGSESSRTWCTATLATKST